VSTQFKLSILAGDAPNRPPAQIAPGFDLAEIPLSMYGVPAESETKWAERKAEIASWRLPPIGMSSHYFGGGLVASGPVVDNELINFWAPRGFRRMAELGVKVVGCYGAHFPVPEGFSKTKAMDQAVAYVNRMADEARKYGQVIALEPMAKLDTLFPRYVDGLAFVKEVNRREVRIMADLAYFLKLEQPISDIARQPEWCVHVHIAGDKGQPGVGDMSGIHLKLFRQLRDINYQGAVSCACPWIATNGASTMDFGVETGKTLAYLRELRDRAYNG
jgi:sugar phosphate isomerase/epimerase